MWYHAITDFGESRRFWWNRGPDELVEELLAPLLSKHVVVVSRRSQKSLFNFAAVSYVTIVRTANKLKRPGEGKVPPQLKDIAFVNNHNATEEFVNEIRILQSA